jgi:hypothetical protein
MGTVYSDQMTNEVASPRTFNNGHEHGPVLRKHFSYTVPVGGITTTDSLQLASLPANAVLLGGKFAQDALGNSITIGDGTTADKYLGSTSVASAGETFFGNTLALFYGQELTSAIVLTATPAVGAWTAGKIIKGYIAYKLKQ